MSTSALLTADNITIRIKDTFLFENTSWELKNGEHWIIQGENGAGKTTFAKALAGLLPLKRGIIKLHFVIGKHPYPSLHKDKIVYLSFDTQQHFISREELEKEFQSFVGKKEKGLTVRKFLGKSKNIFDISNLLHQEVSTLSTGEQRKVFLIKAIQKNPKILILDEPFEGLDSDSKKNLQELLTKIAAKTSIILITHNAHEVPEFITHVMQVKNGKIDKLNRINNSICHPELDSGFHEIPKRVRNDKISARTIIQMKNATVKRGPRKILNNINWQVRQGENWAILGPNGAGKSTLLKLISGDQIQGYSNDIILFGKTRDEWPLFELKKNIGVISSDIMIQYQNKITALEVILSGNNDSIGLYKKANAKEIIQAKVCAKLLNIQNLTSKIYTDLSFGQKRLILLARAIVKNPKLLILDEPCHGLDIQYKKKVLNVIDELAKKTTILYVTHTIHEIPSCITNTLWLKKGTIEKIGQK